jgi:competence ComEA-like helix-hairpin-helix protein
MGSASIMTVDSSVDNLNAAGEERVNIQSADERSLAAIKGITPDIAKAIVAYRGQNRFNSVADLLDVTAAQNQDQSGQASTGNQGNQGQSNQNAPASAANASSPNQSGSNPSGRKVISEELFMDIADDVTLQSGGELPGVININTASLEVLACLPGVSRELAQAIISFRQSDGFFLNIAGLLRVPGMNRDLFKQLAPLVSARSETFRILSEGRVNSTGTRQRIQEIVHVGLHQVVTVSYREDDL